MYAIAFRGLMILGLIAAPASAPSTAPRRAVGQVLQRTIYADEFGIDEKVDPNVVFNASNEKLWRWQNEVTRAFGRPILERFQRDEKLQATDAELDAFVHRSRERHAKNITDLERKVAELEEQLNDKSLAEDAKTKLRGELAEQQKFLANNRMIGSFNERGSRAVGGKIILAWKTQRALHRKYDGRIIFQQFGPEALDGMRKLYEEAEKAGDLRFDDPGIRHLMFNYYEMKHLVLDDPNALERAWFLEPATKPAK